MAKTLRRWNSATPAPVTCAAWISRFTVESICVGIRLRPSGRMIGGCCGAAEAANSTSANKKYRYFPDSP